jgi:hypothetical protein
MLQFDIGKFRQLAFGRAASSSDHPLREEKAFKKMLADLPHDALAGLAELTHWASSVNMDQSFTPEGRMKVLMALDVASRPFWGELAAQYLAPDGTPAEGRDGDQSILRAFLESAAAFAVGYGFGLASGDPAPRWIAAQLPQIALQRARWLGRRYTLGNMLHLPNIDDTWEDLHQLYVLCDQRQILRKVTQVHPGKPVMSSVRQEYTRILLTDMAGLEALYGRDIELAYRIAGRIAVNARLEPEQIPGAICAIELRASCRPIAVRRLPEGAKAVLYLDAFNCLPRLKAFLERNMDADLSEPDVLFGSGYTLRERNAMLNRLIDLWGPTPPQRRSKRIPFKATALVKAGFESAVEVMKALEQGDLERSSAAAPALQIVLEPADAAPKPERIRKSLEAGNVKLVDASVGGLGLMLPRKDAPWARLGMLIAVYVEPGPDWVIGVLRRISAVGDLIGLGIAVLSREPKVAWFRLEATGYASVWEEEKRMDRNFLEHFQRGIVLDADCAPLGPGELLLAPGIAERGSRLDIPLARSTQRIRITALREATEDFHRVAFEPHGITPH